MFQLIPSIPVPALVMPAVNGCIDVPHASSLRQGNHKQESPRNNGVEPCRAL
jgi:hypothetical protein